MNDFDKDFAALKKKYPTHFLIAWTPENFQSAAPRQLTDKDCKDIAKALSHAAIHDMGVNWERVEEAVGEVGIR